MYQVSPLEGQRVWLATIEVLKAALQGFPQALYP
jgi:hypothetical protein